MKRKNEKFLEIHINSKKYGKHSILLDYDDFYLLKNEIYIKKDKTYKKDTFYAYINNTRLHRLIMNCPKDMVVDHINHNTLDNRKCNLKICTQRENIKNRKYKKNIDEECIYWHKRDKTYDVIYIENNKRLFLGRSKYLDESIKIRDEFIKEVKNGKS